MVFFCVLGRVAVSVDGTEQVLGSAREAALLGDLLVHANEVVSADRLIDDLWHGEPPAGAAATLHTYVRNLRRRLEPRRASRAVSEMLLTRRPGYQLLVDRDGLDSWRAERWIREGRDALAVGDVRRARELFTDALTLWEGPPFGELADEPFVRTEAARLEDLRLVALEERASAALALGDHFAMCGELEAVVAQHPYRERLWELWMLALYRAGRQTEALRAYQRIRGLLVDELGIEPGAALRDLEDAILLQKPDLDWYPTSESVSETSALTVPVASLSRRPDFTNAFVGREQERTGLVALIQPPTAVPVTTVTGPAGIGKTRLALHAAADVAGAYSDGAWLVELASVDAADAVADVVLTHLGGRRHAGRSALASLSEFARDRRMLVVLDNCEHVVGTAAACVDAIAGGESVTLATSREPLGLPGERVFFVPSLPDDAAVALFADRAAAIDPSFSLDEGNNVTVAEICRELDGMPLAIELAAARVRSMTVTDIADRLAARFRLLQGGPAKEHRHRTLRAAVQWSYDLLTDRQRAVFDELSAFRGGFTLEAVAAVCPDEARAPMDVFEVIDVVDALVARCLVVVHRSGATTRYSLLETFRQFGEDALVGRADAPTHRARHARHFLAVAEDARRQISTPEVSAGMAVFETEWDNLRAALDWFVANDDADGALRLVVASYWFAGPGFRSEALTWAERAIVLDGARRHAHWSAAAGVTALLRRGIGDFQGGETLALEALKHEALRGVRARFEPAFGLLCCLYRRDDERALQILPKVERIAESGGDPIELANARYMRVVLDVVRGVEALHDSALQAVSDAERTCNPIQMALAYAGLVAVTSQDDRDATVRVLDKVRRWAHLANNPMIAANAALWLAGAPNAKPLDAVTFVRDALVGSFDGGYFGNLDLSLGPLVIALPEFGRHRSAVILLGGLMTMPASDSQRPDLIVDATARLSEVLGEDFRPLLDQGRALPKRELARLALSDIDLVLAKQQES